MKPLRRSPVIAAVTGSRGLRGQVVPAIGEVRLSDDLALTLRLGAAACGVDEPEFVRRAIAEKAERIGLSSLCDSASRAANISCPHAVAPLALAADGRDTCRDAGSGLRALPEFTSDGDLIDVPTYARRDHSGFASGP